MPLLLHPRPPYNFPLSCRVFSEGDPSVRRFEQGTFRQVLRVNEKLVLVQVRDVGEEWDPILAVDILPGAEVTPGEREKVEEQVSSLLSIHDDLEQFFSAIRGDPVMAGISRDLLGLRAPQSATVFEALVTSIIEQQISIKVARVIEARMVRKFGERLEVAGRTYFAYPVPEDLEACTAEDFRSCGLSARKGEYIREAAGIAAGGTLDLESLKDVHDSNRVIEELCELRGVGRWTAEFVLLRGMHRLDIIPADDLGVRRAIARAYLPGERISADQARAIAEQWGEWKGLAAYYLLAAENDVQSRGKDREGPGKGTHDSKRTSVRTGPRKGFTYI
ncbi:MAG TPA: DNA-3-methyladenine glycosylase [Methanolinea sp.]|nr:DNA-3-methyladenine glycosylase [Methanolinea sp.]HQK56313.1 DNA-3-methyladenine glycosylase [Methanolinea sp.]